MKKSKTDTNTIILFTLFFLSGLSGLIYESAWLQQLSLIFGSTELAIAAVLAAYMGGLAIGASTISLFLVRIKNPLLVYVIIEIVIAFTALSVPFLLDIVSLLSHLIQNSAQLQSMTTSNTIFYIVGSFIVLLVPTTLMGATLPLLSKYIVKKNDNIGNKIGLLYSVNTFGACCGALVSAFVLLPFLGLGFTVYVAVLINIIIFIVGIYYFRNNSTISLNTNNLERQSGVFKNRWIFPIMFISGSVSFAYEILWTRLLSHILGGSVYSFGVMLFVFLLAIAVGAYLGSLICKRFNAINSFIWVQLCIALTFFLSFYCADLLPNIPLARDYGSFSFVYESIFIGLLTLFPGALFIGATFPLAINITAKNNKHSGIVSAKVYTWNTLGAICGSILMGFYLMSTFGLANSAKILASISIILALLTTIFSNKNLRTLIVTSLFLLLVWITPLNNPMKLLTFSVLGHKSQPGEIKYLGIGESATVMLIDQIGDMRLLTNGLPESSIQIDGSREGKYYLAHWLSMLPVLINPEAKDMLIVGFGAGITVKATPRSIERIDVVELEREVINANKILSKWRGIDPLNDSRLNLHINDARNALRNSSQKFDIIVSQPSHPWTAGAANLYTQEFFTLIKSRLRPKGVFVQWIGTRFVDVELLKSLLATLNSEFKNVELYQPLSKGGLIFVSSNETTELSGLAFETTESKIKWHELGINNTGQIFLSKRLDAKGSKILSIDAQISTDYFNLLKLRSPKIIKTSLNKLQLNNFLAKHDPLIELINQKTYVIIRRLIKEKDFHRAGLLVNHIDDDLSKQISLALIADAQNKTLEDKSKSTETLRDLLVRLRADYEQSRQQEINEITFLLIQRNLKAIINQRMPNLQEIIATNDLAQNIINAARLIKLKKWSRLKLITPLLDSIDDNHPAYEIANILSIQWRINTDDVQQLNTALKLIDNRISVVTEVKLLVNRAEVGLKLGYYNVSLASLYEMIASASKSKQVSLFIQNFLTKMINKAVINNEYSDDLKLKIKKLQNLL